MFETDKSLLKKAVCEAIEERAQEIRDIKTDIWNHPELGYKEFRTAEKVAECLRPALAFPYRTGLGITGVRADLEGRARAADPASQDSAAKRPTVGIFRRTGRGCGWDHVNADKKTGAVHACGHDAQIASMLGAAMV